jgi:hypothetical protein
VRTWSPSDLERLFAFLVWFFICLAGGLGLLAATGFLAWEFLK